MPAARNKLRHLRDLLAAAEAEADGLAHWLQGVRRLHTYESIRRAYSAAHANRDKAERTRDLLRQAIADIDAETGR